jgi:hypothetical protein
MHTRIQACSIWTSQSFTMSWVDIYKVVPHLNNNLWCFARSLSPSSYTKLMDHMYHEWCKHNFKSFVSSYFLFSCIVPTLHTLVLSLLLNGSLRWYVVSKIFDIKHRDNLNHSITGKNAIRTVRHWTQPHQSRDAHTNLGVQKIGK